MSESARAHNGWLLSSWALHGVLCRPRDDQPSLCHLSCFQPEVKTSISLFMAYVHTTVNEMSKIYLTIERRYNYTTPKTFLEQIKLYQNLLAKKRMELEFTL